MRCSLNIFVGSAGGVKDHALQMMNLYLECGIVKTCMLVCLSVQCLVQSTPDNSNLPGKSKKGSSSRRFEENCREQGEKKKNSFYSTVNILITLILIEEMSSEN